MILSLQTNKKVGTTGVLKELHELCVLKLQIEFNRKGH